MKVWSRFSYPRTGSNGGPFWTWLWTFRFQKSSNSTFTPYNYSAM